MITFAQKGNILGPPQRNFLTPFWHIFRIGTPSAKSALKVTFVIEKYIISLYFGTIFWLPKAKQTSEKHIKTM